MNEQERYLKRMSEHLKDIGTTLWRINDCLERIYRDLQDRVPMPKEENVKNDATTGDEGIPKM